jgi:DeoR/GlpR family transcriptional regulator of sugar metabolism
MPTRASHDHDDDRATRLPAGRKAELAAYVAERGEVTVSALAARFGVSADTVRRDLDQLDNEGLLIRTHGGAVSAHALPRPDTGLDVRLRIQVEAKETIGALAAQLVEDGSSLMVNGGTTVLALVRQLRNHRDLTIATNNLRLPMEIPTTCFRDLYVFGGPVRLVTQTTSGPVQFHVSANGSEHPVRCDLALVAVGGVSADDGYSTSNLEDAAMMRDMMERATKVAVLVDSSKFGRRLFAQVAPLYRADYFITDAAPSPELAEALTAAEVQLVNPESSPR